MHTVRRKLPAALHMTCAQAGGAYSWDSYSAVAWPAKASILGPSDPWPHVGASGADANDDMFWKELPAALRTDMALELAAPLFRHSDIFKGMDPASERLVATRLTPLVVPAGHNVVQEGDEADALFLLQEGAPRGA